MLKKLECAAASTIGVGDFRHLANSNVSLVFIFGIPPIVITASRVGVRRSSVRF